MPTTAPPLDFEQPTVFDQLLEPVGEFVDEQDAQLPRHPGQKYEYKDFFRLLIYYCTSGADSLKRLVEVNLNNGLLSPDLGLRPVPYSTCQDAFGRFPPSLFQSVFEHVLSVVSFKRVPELAALGTLHCIDGSLFPVISSMLWADYTKNHQALKLHLCFELNRMIPVDFLVGSGNSSERDALRAMLASGVTYIADRGYMAFALCHDITQAQAHFIFRTKKNLLLTVVEGLPVCLPTAAHGLFQQVTDEMIRYDNDPHGTLWRLVRFRIGKEVYCLLTDRRDLTTFQVILLYAYRWQIELLFRFLKRTVNGIHLIRHDQEGATIQFYSLMISALLSLRLNQCILDDQGNQDQENLPSEPMETDLPKAASSGRVVSGAEFVTLLNSKVKKYWKIGIYWLTALRELLDCPFDQKAVGVLSKL